MGKKVSIKDLYKIEKKVTVTDDSDREAEVVLRIISDGARAEALDAANESRAELKRKLDDPNSKESILMAEDLDAMPIENIKRHIGILKRRVFYEELFIPLRGSKKYSDKSNKELGEDEEFQKALNSAVDEELEKYNKKIKDDEESLKRELKSLRVDLALDSCHLKGFNEVSMLNAIRDPEDSNKRLFDSVEEMRGSFFGDTYIKLMNAYYSLDDKTGDEVKN